ncbi:hypothetical protein O7543_03505 [Solwaraspora sp. WMMA2080]|uniref:hypothetical protein n=1 Tax=unclassified Solwaraspora TaxID=2627926 RepID=UPI00248C8959|nr:MULTISPECIES: hypothetical protein [unclassified Solwaraspora]WBB99888.1 hypothetical protein O7553_13865 [Solwaraspora sp. WMMA2059]WBC21564.1 hypothetical protein O7543_03505 [Solwaraspora sp. WMMA2080]
MAFALTACTDSDATPTDDRTDGELRQVRVAALPSTETAALWGGIGAGIFAERGIEVEVLPAQGGAQAIPALINGDIGFAIGQPFGEVAFPDVPAQLEAGNIEAAWVPEPFVTQLRDCGDAVVVEPYQAVMVPASAQVGPIAPAPTGAPSTLA